LPTTPFQPFFKRGQLSVQEAVYGYTGWIFCQHFLNRLGSEYTSLTSVVDISNVAHAEVLSKIKKRLRSDTFTREYILDIITLYPGLIKHCYNHFALTHHVSSPAVNLGYFHVNKGHHCRFFVYKILPFLPKINCVRLSKKQFKMLMNSSFLNHI
jgi:glutamate dehydrogenase